MRKKSLLGWYIVLFLFLIITLFPIYWMVITSAKSFNEIYSLIPKLWVKKIHFENYKLLFQKYDFGISLVNSIIISSIVSVITIFVSMMSAYAVSRMNFKTKSIMPQFFLLAYLIPRTILFIPMYLLLAKIGLLNSIWGLILVYPTITIPYATWVLITYFQGFSKEMEEAACVDGASRMQTIWKIVFPVTVPTLVSTLIFSFTLCWSEYIYALVAINNVKERTITVSLSSMLVADVIPWGPLSAGAVLSALPIMIIYMFMSKYIVSGLTVGSVKG